MARVQSTGTCCLCKAAFPKASMSRHLVKCAPAHDPTVQAEQAKAKHEKLFRLVVEGKYNPVYWLYLELPATATLGHLDQFLRKIWLECCGHLSAFRVEGQKRPARPSLAELLATGADAWRDPAEPDMEQEVGDHFKKGLKIAYDYDFGSTTKLSIKVVGERDALVQKPHEVHLLARNDPPHIPCGRCHQAAATIIDMESGYDQSGWQCEECAKRSGLAKSDMTLPVVNSPRTGVCGYTGD